MSQGDKVHREWEPWQLSAFVLGELDGDLAAKIQAAVDEDHLLKEEVQAIRETVGEVESVFSAEADMGLSKSGVETRLAAIFERAADIEVTETEFDTTHKASIVTQGVGNWRVTALGLLAMSACLFVAIWFSLPNAGDWRVANEADLAKGDSVGSDGEGQATVSGTNAVASPAHGEDLPNAGDATSSDQLALEEETSKASQDSMEGSADTQLLANGLDSSEPNGDASDLSEEQMQERRKAFFDRLKSEGLNGPLGRADTVAELAGMPSDGEAATAVGELPSSDFQIEFIEEIDLVVIRGSKKDAAKALEKLEEIKSESGYSNFDLAIEETDSQLAILGQPAPRTSKARGNEFQGGLARASGGMGGGGLAGGGYGGGGYGDAAGAGYGSGENTESSVEAIDDSEAELVDLNSSAEAPTFDLRLNGVAEKMEREQLLPLLMREQELVDSVPENHPAVATLRNRIDALRDQIEKVRESEQRVRLAQSQVELGDRFTEIYENRFQKVGSAPLSTFSIDVDTASYAKTRQLLLEARRLPPPGAVRIEELVNYFDYEYTGPKNDEAPFGVDLAITDCPWRPRTKLVRIAMQAEKLDYENRPKANIVFLLDVSGSMDKPNKLPLVKESIEMLVQQLGKDDRVAIVVYAGAAGCVLESTSGTEQEAILEALEGLSAGGSTNGGDGIQKAYELARNQFVEGGINRVILCTDGDFNVGVTSTDELIDLVEENAKSNVFLTVLGFGMGNTNDEMMEEISNRGNGVYGFVDNRREAHRQMVRQVAGNLMTVAKDVKVQVEFNPDKVLSYRLLGYENRLLSAADFEDDKKDAGEIGAGHRVTALYEILPTSKELDLEENGMPDLRYKKNYPSSVGEETASKDKDEADPLASEWLCVKLRYKQPEGETSILRQYPLEGEAVGFEAAERDFQWAASMVEFGMLLRDSRFVGNASWSGLLEQATSAAGISPDADRKECLEMMQMAAELSDIQRRAARTGN